jgi:uncharacterized spore protein YtfJ
MPVVCEGVGPVNVTDRVVIGLVLVACGFAAAGLGWWWLAYSAPIGFGAGLGVGAVRDLVREWPGSGDPR